MSPQGICVRNQWTTDLRSTTCHTFFVTNISQQILFQDSSGIKTGFKFKDHPKTHQPTVNCFLSGLRSNHTNPTWGVTKVKGAKTLQTGWEGAEPSTPIASQKRLLEIFPIHDAFVVEKTPQKKVKSWLKTKTKALESDPANSLRLEVGF